MKLGVHIGYWGLGLTREDQLEVVQEAERLGYDSVWTAEAYGSDAATILGWIAGQTTRIKIRSAIPPMPARAPAMTAMTGATPDRLGDPPDARGRAGHDGDDRRDPRPALRRADAAGHRLERPAGVRGLAR